MAGLVVYLLALQTLNQLTTPRYRYRSNEGQFRD